MLPGIGAISKPKELERWLYASGLPVHEVQWRANPIPIRPNV